MMQRSHAPSTPPAKNRQPDLQHNLNLRGLFLTAVVDGGIAYFFYILLAPHFPANSIYPLLISSIAPALSNIFSLIRHRHLDFLGVIILFGIFFSLAATVVTGDPKLLLVRESFFTGGFGLVCLLSMLFPRPLLFVLMRHFITGNDPDRIKRFNARWNSPSFRRFNQVITFVWGIGLLSEFAIRIILIYTLPVAQVLAISPIVLNVITILLILWTLRYGMQNRRPGGALNQPKAEIVNSEPAPIVEYHVQSPKS